jgi:hypothetical protein
VGDDFDRVVARLQVELMEDARGHLDAWLRTRSLGDLTDRFSDLASAWRLLGSPQRDDLVAEAIARLTDDPLAHHKLRQLALLPE